MVLPLLLAVHGLAAGGIERGGAAYNQGDYGTALREWRPLAEHGNAGAQLNLGFMYDNGYGVPVNDKTAIKWYTLAAEQGYANAQYNVGVMYDFGRGVPENDKTAVKWYTLAAEQGNANAQGNMGYMYDIGKGVLTDTKRAYMWYNLAGYNGSEIGSKNKDKLAKQMTPADISKAQDMSSRCLESNYTDC